MAECWNRKATKNALLWNKLLESLTTVTLKQNPLWSGLYRFVKDPEAACRNCPNMQQWILKGLWAHFYRKRNRIFSHNSSSNTIQVLLYWDFREKRIIKVSHLCTKLQAWTQTECYCLIGGTGIPNAIDSMYSSPRPAQAFERDLAQQFSSPSTITSLTQARTHTHHFDTEIFRVT